MKLTLVTALIAAYVMPAYSILKRLASGRDDLTVTSLKVNGVGSVAPVLAKDVAPAFNASWSSGELALTATMSIRFPARCRLDLSSTDGAKTISAIWNNGKKRMEGGELAAAQVAVEQLCATLALRSGTEGESRAALERHLGALKVDSRQVSFARFAGTVAFVLGNRADGNAQFWVYKDRFLPARVRFTDATGQWDVRFTDYTSQPTGEWFPRIVEVFKGTEAQLRLTVLSADGKAELEAVKF